MVAAIRTGKRKYWISTAVYAALWIVLLTMILAPPEDSLMYDLSAIPLFACMIVPAVHAAIWNRDYLTTIAHKSAWHAQYVAPNQAWSPQQHSSGFLGVSNANYYAPGSPPPPPPVAASSVPVPSSAPQRGQAPTPHQTALLNINTASAADLVEGLGIDQSLANHVIGARQARGGFRDIDDFATGAGLQPHHLIRFRNRVSFSAASQGQDPTAQTGRILDF